MEHIWRYLAGVVAVVAIGFIVAPYIHTKGGSSTATTSGVNGSAQVQNVNATGAKDSCPYWIDVKTGTKPLVGPVGWKGPLEEPTDTTNSAGSYSILPDGSWINVKTGTKPAVGPPGYQGPTLNGTEFFSGGHTYALVPCPPPQKTPTPAPLPPPPPRVIPGPGTLQRINWVYPQACPQYGAPHECYVQEGAYGGYDNWAKNKAAFYWQAPVGCPAGKKLVAIKDAMCKYETSGATANAQTAISAGDVATVDCRQFAAQFKGNDCTCNNGITLSADFFCQ